jgi:hypothetical protein
MIDSFITTDTNVESIRNHVLTLPASNPTASTSRCTTLQIPSKGKQLTSTSLKWKKQVMGSKKLDAQLRQLKSKVHVFGHSHINWNQIIDGVHYVQRALRYPRYTIHYSIHEHCAVKDKCG